MGLFDRKREEPAPTPAPKQDSAPTPEATPVVAQEPKVKVAAPAPTPAPAPAPASAEFGIQKAIELMRKLPADNVMLVVQVVRATLESTNVDVSSIIQDARTKRARIAKEIGEFRTEIAEFEEEIAARRELIEKLEADEAETKLVQDRLEMSMNGGGGAGTSGTGQAAMEKAVFEDPVPKRPF